MAQMVRAMRAILSMESLGNDKLRGDDGRDVQDVRKLESTRQSTLEDEIDALEVIT